MPLKALWAFIPWVPVIYSAFRIASSHLPTAKERERDETKKVKWQVIWSFESLL